MQEFVGRCKECGNNIYCNDGFINGVVQEDKSLLCFDCAENQPEEGMRGSDPV